MHYSSFQEAKNKWNDRMARINEDNPCVMFTNWDGDMNSAKRFEKLPFKYKVLFTDHDIPEINCSFTIKNGINPKACTEPMAYLEEGILISLIM